MLPLLLATCTPTAIETAARARAALERDAKAPDPEFLGMLTPSSATYVERLAEAGRFADLRTRLVATLKAARPGDAEGVVVGTDPDDTLFFVRDGHCRRLDLALSGATRGALREAEYPAPW
jgi:hypothetical protein